MVLRRLLGALCIALLISGAFTLLLAKKLNRSHQGNTSLRYVTATRDVNAGEILGANDIVETNWPATAPVNGAVLLPAEAVGRAVMSPLGKGQPLLSQQLSAVGGLGLSARVPNGMRAISLRSDEVVGVAGFLLPGTHIDVLVTYRTQGTSDSVTATVLQDAEILATGQKTQPDPDGRPTTTDVVTLLVSPADAERVVLASSQGTLHFVMRNGADRQQGIPKPVNVAALGLTPTSLVPNGAMIPVMPRRGTPAPARHQAPAPYSVTVVRGDKQTVETF